MNTNKLFKWRILAAVILSVVSCTNGTDNTEKKNETSEITFNWTAVPGASGYVVMYGVSPEYGTTIETAETSITITGLDKNLIYNIKILTKEGYSIPSLPSNPMFYKGGVMVGSGAVTGNPNDTGKKKNEPEPFDHNVFMAQKATWEAQNFNHYRFTGGTLFTGDYTVTVLPNGSIVVIDKGSGKIIDNDEKWKWMFSPLSGRTIDELYGSILDAVAEAEAFVHEGLYKVVYIQYDETYHYPKYYTENLFLREGIKEGYLGTPPTVWVTDFKLLANEVVN